MSKRFVKFTIAFAMSTVMVGVAQFCWAADGKDVKYYIDLARTNSPRIKSSQLAYDKTMLSLKGSELNDSILAKMQTDINRRNAERAKITEEKNLILDVETGYADIIRAQKALEIATKSDEQAKNQYKMVQLRYEKSVASKIDLITAERQVKSSVISLRNAQNDLNNALLSFQKLIGTNEQVAVIEAATPEAAVNVTLENAIEKAVANSEDIKTAQDLLTLAKLESDLAQNEFTSDNEKASKTIAVTENQMALDQKIDEVKTTVTSMYNDLINAYDQIAIARMGLDLATEKNRVTDLKVNAGIETESSRTQSQIELTSANIDVLNAISNYNKALSRFNSYIGVTESK